jgi:hypothetical protein
MAVDIADKISKSPELFSFELGWNASNTKWMVVARDKSGTPVWSGPQCEYRWEAIRSARPVIGSGVRL